MIDKKGRLESRDSIMKSDASFKKSNSSACNSIAYEKYMNRKKFNKMAVEQMHAMLKESNPNEPDQSISYGSINPESMSLESHRLS